MIDYMPRVVTVHLMGGLGNQLFQIAAAYAYAKDNGLELALPSSWADRPDRPPLWNSYLDISKWKNIINEDQYNKWVEFCEKYNLDMPASIENEISKNNPDQNELPFVFGINLESE